MLVSPALTSSIKADEDVRSYRESEAIPLYVPVEVLAVTTICPPVSVELSSFQMVAFIELSSKLSVRVSNFEVVRVA
jgi:hypothetical protein